MSICAADLGAVAAALGDAGVEYTREFVLQARPVDGSVRVEVDGARTDAWTVDEAVPVLIFDAAPAPDAEIVVRYTLATGEG